MSQQQRFTHDESAGSINDHHDSYAQQEETKASTKHRDSIDFQFIRLLRETLNARPEKNIALKPESRTNRNVTLCAAITRLLKEIYLSSITYSRNYQLLCGIPLNVSNNQFLLVMRTDGRIIAISDEAKHHLRKEMRVLYAQMINILDCLDNTDRDKLQTVFRSSVDFPNQEHSLICTLRLPKGKRPSRINEDVTTINMSGHFYACDDESSSSEKLFIAHCEPLISSTAKGKHSSQSVTKANSDNSRSTIMFTLQENMMISDVSLNVKDILGYKRQEMIGQYFGRYLIADYLEKFETIRQKFFEHAAQQQPPQQQKASPMNVFEVLDMYGNNGDERLTFLCQLRIHRKPRSKPIEFIVTAQLIDPSLRDQYIQCMQSELEINPISTEIQQFICQHLHRSKNQPSSRARRATWTISCTATSQATTPINHHIHHSTDSFQAKILSGPASTMNFGSKSVTSSATHPQATTLSITNNIPHSFDSFQRVLPHSVSTMEIRRTSLTPTSIDPQATALANSHNFRHATDSFQMRLLPSSVSIMTIGENSLAPTTINRQQEQTSSTITSTHVNPG
ncbi:unnamed protein product [Rotaria socialis]|uniref:PAS domain-containing protein n=1 Tax=Rotaria socialis TaxID=392032 RepID=A0A820ECL5_9BILA|nr:unnamed protein product [Rotaria socialis]CAF4244350.1 unnamed protein product [Rotaria socialis]